MHVIFGFIIFSCLIAGFHPFHENPKGELTLVVGDRKSVV
jgi:hypothetical protein